MKKETSFQYNNEYFKTISEAYVKTAKKINKVRWDFVREIKPKISVPKIFIVFIIV